ncbi:MAG: hypothetical protein AB8C13_05790 [Phycisphaerales bacterium]
MNSLLDTLFGFEQGTFGAPDSGMGFVHTIPGWVWFLSAVGLAVLITLSYRKLPGGAAIRGVLGCIRWGVLMMLLALALGPQIEQSRTLVEPDRVIVLLDHSGSMLMPETNPDGSSSSRAAQLGEALDEQQGIFDSLSDDSIVEVYQFAQRATATDLPPAIDATQINLNASTSIGSSIQSAINNAGTSPISGVVVFSDGQSQDQPAPELVESLLASGIPVIGVPIGANEPVRDVSVTLVESPQAVFAKDRVPVRVLGRAAGYEDGDEVLVELIEQQSGRVLTSRTHVLDAQLSLDVSLTHTFNDPGAQSLTVRVSPSEALDELNRTMDVVPDNNEQPLDLRVVSEPIRVLYIDGHPRWEYRYLKNTLMREQTINATTMLLASNRRFIEEGVELSGPIPDSLETWEPFDVVILGDLRPDLFSPAQLETLKEHIQTRGCGLMWIAGEGATPDAWSGSPLSGLLPMQSGKADSASRTTVEGSVVMKLTDEAVRAGLLSEDDRENLNPQSRVGSQRAAIENADAGWTVLRWNHSIHRDDLKPGVTVLASALQIENASSQSAEEPAIVTSMRYGAGQIGFVGTDEIWRWRYGRGEDLPEQFWLPMIRTLARGTISRRASPAALTINPATPALGSSIQVTLDLFDTALISELPSDLQTQINPISYRAEQRSITMTGTGQRRATLWTPNEPGVYSVSLSHPLIGSDPLTQIVRVQSATDESSNPNTNHQSLADLASQTNGQILGLNQLSELPDLLPNRTRITTLPPITTALWDRPIVLILLIFLLSGEWITRRILRLA